MTWRVRWYGTRKLAQIARELRERGYGPALTGTALRDRGASGAYGANILRKVCPGPVPYRDVVEVLERV